ncbi:MAG: DUF4910 domain-containing protein [Desulfovibrio sp.]|jgi:aminopeptidase-like protein|nr:DUF4910 domain-containing protein [Desulfovibrio sp.]
MLDLLKKLFPICRSITGNGVRETLAILREHLPGLAVHEIPSGTQVFDWIVPDEWNVRGAGLTGPNGETIADFADSNLHVVGYSEAVDRVLSLEELQEHLHSRPDMPDAIPYVTSYYSRRWGFCLAHERREKLMPGLYHARIDATLAPGSLTYGELLIPGKEQKEVFLTTYICHPSMANNELSGPVVLTELARWLLSEPRRYTYRIVFAPETIGAIAYLSFNAETLKERVVAGFNLTCMGDERAYSYLPSRRGGTLADRIALHVLKRFYPDFVSYTFLDRQSDERQYCAPGIDLPLCSVMRTKYEAYPEYHTSLDNLDVVTEKGLAGGYAIMRRCLEALEENFVYATEIPCEPQMGRRGLYPTLSTVGNTDGYVTDMMNLLAYTDGQTPLLDIAETIGLDIFRCSEMAKILLEKRIIHK